MPANNGIRPNDGERLAGFRKQMADPTQNHPVDGQKWHPTGPTSSQHDDLLPQHQDLGFQRRARSTTTIPKIILQRSNIPHWMEFTAGTVARFVSERSSEIADVHFRGTVEWRASLVCAASRIGALGAPKPLYPRRSTISKKNFSSNDCV